MPIPAGKLTHRVRIERRVTGKGALGGALDDWEPVATVWAWPMFGTGQERREAAQAAAIAPATFRLRRSRVVEEVTPEYRLRCDPVRRSPDFSVAPIWEVKSVTAPADEPDAVDLTAVRLVQ